MIPDTPAKPLKKAFVDASLVIPESPDILVIFLYFFCFISCDMVHEDLIKFKKMVKPCVRNVVACNQRFYKTQLNSTQHNFS